MNILQAVKSARVVDVESALLAGADPNTRDDSGYSLLHWSCQEGFIDVIELLLRFGADVNAQDDEGFRPLEVAINCGRTEAAARLLSSSRELELQATRDGFGYLHACAAAGDSTILAMLLGFPATLPLINDQDQGGEGFTPLHWAAQIGDAAIVDLLLRSGADPEIVDVHGFAPLHIAVGEGRLEVASLLVRDGVDINTPCAAWGGGTCLHLACLYEREALFESLISLGADKSIRDRSGKTAMDYRLG